MMRLILIGGAQRSGTTLLQTLLASSLESPNLPEAHILCDIFTAYKRSKEFGNKTSYFYADDDLLAFFRAFAERHVSDIVASAKPGAALVLKDPNFIQVLQEAVALFPRSVRIVCLRDPRDIAASFVQIGQRHSATKPGKYERRDIKFISKKILASYLPIIQEPKPADVIFVRYEALASDPKACLKALARDAALELSLDGIDQPVWLDAQARHEASWITELEGAEASPSSIGSFKRVLTGDEVAMVQQICEPIMIQFGYAPVETPLRRGRFFWLGQWRPGKR
jgi:hypothetical protein